MKKRTLIIITIAIVVIIGGYFGITSFMSQANKNLEALDNITIENVDLTKMPDGTYEGKYKVFPVEVEVSVDVKDHKITGIELLKHKNGQGKKAEVITEKVVENQSLNVDMISGATYSSKVILKAIENALSE